METCLKPIQNDLRFEMMHRPFPVTLRVSLVRAFD